MKITGIRAWQVNLPLVEGRYSWSNGNFVEVFDATVVAIDTDAGITGFGECTPLGAAYLPAYADGVRAGLKELAPKLIGLDPRHIDVVNLHMDAALLGHAYVKSPVDVACWDLLGKAAGLPCHMLLGGDHHPAGVPLYRAISQRPAAEMAGNLASYRDQGYRMFQLKVGGSVEDDIARIRACAAKLQPGDKLFADANTGWTMHEAARVVNAVRDLDVTIEQPCRSYAECLAIRRRTPLPFTLDENIDGLDALQRGLADGAMDAINIKISKLGGLTKARLVRDVAVHAGLMMIVEDTWGGDIATAAIAHLARSTPSEFLLAATDFNSYGTKPIAAGAPARKDGRMTTSDRPGLGITPDLAMLGKPVLEVS